MRRRLQLFLVIALSVATVANAYDRRSDAQRTADESRQKMVDKAKKDMEAKEAAKRQAAMAVERAKRQAAATLERTKQQEVDAKFEAEHRERRKRLFDEAPKEFFAKYIENKLVSTEYGLDTPPTLRGRLVQIPSDNLLIVALAGTAQWVALEGYKTGGLVDDMEVTFPAKMAGTFRYTSVLGAVKTVPRFVPPVTLNYGDFVALQTKGVNVLQALEDYLYRNNLTWQ